ncbi:hypothetical protein [Streptomyces atratus]|uniref:hypothetical protein n=1 Tax=Streptomyces atratus TaxID=1893 RepID=UPI0013004A0B|nr:hypothetical protein [Streptomyces atratus]
MARRSLNEFAMRSDLCVYGIQRRTDSAPAEKRRVRDRQPRLPAAQRSGRCVNLTELHRRLLADLLAVGGDHPLALTVAVTARTRRVACREPFDSLHPLHDGDPGQGPGSCCSAR